MIVRQVVRQLVNRGISAGINTASNRMGGSSNEPQDKEAAARMKKSAKVTRRVTRM